MKQETAIWTLLLLAGGIFVAYQASSSERGVGQQYVVPIEVVGQIDPATGTIAPPAGGEISDPGNLVKSVRYDRAQKDDPRAEWSLSRTVGVWIAALLTLCVFSYLYRDNPFYKLAESIIVGVSAGYWIVQYGWTVLVGKVLLKLAPDIARYAFLPDTPVDTQPEYLYLIPVFVGCLIFCRLVPRVSWLGRWPLAFIVGTTAGLKLILFLNADFVRQIRSTIVPLVVFSSDPSGTSIDWKTSVQNLVIVISVLSSLTYFYFSVEHKGWVGRISRIGVWVLMISFGASFALTVMGRITLLTMRLQFLFDDWLGLVRM